MTDSDDQIDQIRLSYPSSGAACACCHILDIAGEPSSPVLMFIRPVSYESSSIARLLAQLIPDCEDLDSRGTGSGVVQLQQHTCNITLQHHSTDAHGLTLHRESTTFLHSIYTT